MADVIGPNSYLPGQNLKVPKGMMCDEHPEKPAVVRIVGETDSFGSECCDMCDSCYAAYLKHKEDQKGKQKFCEMCLRMKDNVSQKRHPDEGSAGRLYDMCPSCYSKIVSAFCADDDDDGY